MTNTEANTWCVPAAPASTPPSVTVLMAVHNGQPFVEAALRSVMSQTMQDLDILVVDDCSTDDTPNVLIRLAAEDRRIRIERLPENLMLPRALNHGLGLARGTFIARMDADDLAEPRRLATQLKYLQAHPSSVLVGTSVKQIDEHGSVRRTNIRPGDPYAVRWLARFHMPLVHPTFMFRASLPNGEPVRYDPSWTVSEDYDLVVRMFEHGDVANLPEPLLRYRVHGTSITSKTWKLQQQQGQAISLRHARAETSESIVAGLTHFRAAFYDLKPADPADIFAGLRRMAAEDARSHPLRRRWIRRQAAQLGRHAMQRSGRSPREIIRAFLGPGRDFLPDMALRVLEASGHLPSFLRSDPRVG